MDKQKDCEHLYKDASDERYCVDCGKNIEARLKYLRGEIIAERISYDEIAELQSLKRYIDKNDVQLLEWAGVEEKHGQHLTSSCTLACL